MLPPKERCEEARQEAGYDTRGVSRRPRIGKGLTEEVKDVWEIFDITRKHRTAIIIEYLSTGISRYSSLKK
jgi:hypothetical protein